MKLKRCLALLLLGAMLAGLLCACAPQEEIETIETKTEEIPHGSAD
jgi:hypothetical protein